MTPTPYTEDTLVQQTTAEYLEKQLGWEAVENKGKGKGVNGERDGQGRDA